MEKLHLSDETLMAYADGELPVETAAAVETAMRTNAALVGRVVDFVASRRLAKSTGVAVGLPTVPSTLSAAVTRMQTRHEMAALEDPAVPRRGKVPLMRMVMPAFASAAAVAALFFVIEKARISVPSATMDSTLDRPLAESATAALVANLPSGTERSVEGGTLRLVGTYQAKAAGLCREFALDKPRLSFDGLVCRDASGWSLRFLAARQSESAYVPADGTSPVATYLDKLGASDALGPADEKAALANS